MAVRDFYVQTEREKEGNYAGKKVVNEIFFRTESCR